jgi:CheY-like chemotaxis protein
MMALRILVVEDEGLVALTLEDLLEDLGCEVVGSFGAMGQALSFVASGAELDGALLDVNVAGEPVYPVAEALKARAVPFAFTTGYGQIADRRFESAPILGKPIRREALEQVLRAFESQR